MSDPFYAAVYWGARQEPRDVCAARICAALNELRSVNDQFQNWYKQGRSRKESLQHDILIEIGAIDRLLAAGVNRTDIGKNPIPELGFSLSFWNGGPENGAISLMLRCGVYDIRIGNAVVLNLPRDGEQAKDVIRFDTMSQILEIFARHFVPDWGTVNSTRLRNSVLNIPKEMPQVGWLTYLSRTFGEVPPCPDYELITIAELGTLIVTTREVFSVDDPKHVRSVMAAAEAVHRLINRSPAGLPKIR
jgi:hypothetical protein